MVAGEIQFHYGLSVDRQPQPLPALKPLQMVQAARVQAAALSEVLVEHGVKLSLDRVTESDLRLAVDPVDLLQPLAQCSRVLGFRKVLRFAIGIPQDDQLNWTVRRQG